jgi:hypothetical protein
MKAYKTTFLVAGVLVALFGLTPKTWAGGGEAASACTLIVAKPGQHAIALKGTAAVAANYVDTIGGGIADVDLILRLERSEGNGAPKFFRANDSINNFFGYTNLDVLCQFLPALQSQILSAFGIKSNWKLVLTDKSVSNASDEAFVPGTVTLGGDPRLSGMSEVKIFAVRP